MESIFFEFTHLYVWTFVYIKQWIMKSQWLDKEEATRGVLEIKVFLKI